MSKVFFKNEKKRCHHHGLGVVASGYAAVWAKENTRESLWDAMARKETYATTGTRMSVRFFDGFDYSAGDSKGVPMGCTLTAAPEGKAPPFLIGALKDPIGANLDRYQIVKVWMDKDGAVHEKAYDVVWSGDRSIDKNTGKLAAVGSTVDIKNATWSHIIGASELVATWKDPDFDPQQQAFYYGRVLETPTPRWTAYDAKHYGIEPLPDTRMVLQERAYTSPIWYSPK